MTERTPWRDRPASFTRGWVAGSAVAGWIGLVLYASIVVFTRVDDAVVLGLELLATAALATYMWYHG